MTQENRDMEVFKTMVQGSSDKDLHAFRGMLLFLIREKWEDLATIRNIAITMACMMDDVSLRRMADQLVSQVPISEEISESALDAFEAYVKETDDVATDG